MNHSDIDDFLNSSIGKNKNFKWKEAVYLNRLDEYVLPSKDICENIISTADIMQIIRTVFGKPIIVTSWYRPKKYYNSVLVGGAKNSYHTKGLACDFIVKGYNSDVAREILLDFLIPLDIRMENKPDASWVHIDLGEPGRTGRFFNP